MISSIITVSEEIQKIFTGKNGFQVDLAVNYMIDMEYRRTDLYKTSKDILWKCFGHVLIDNINRNKEKGITLKERPRMCYTKAVDNNNERLDQILTARMQRKSVHITQADIDFMDDVLTKKKNGNYYSDDKEMLLV